MCFVPFVVRLVVVVLVVVLVVVVVVVLLIVLVLCELPSVTGGVVLVMAIVRLSCKCFAGG